VGQSSFWRRHQAFSPKWCPGWSCSATALFAYGGFFGKQKSSIPGLDPRATSVVQFLLAIHGGYFGGGIGFVMLAVLTAAGLAVRSAGATKNILAGVMNASAVAIFVFTPGIP
jgi:uncharacterized protein